MAKTLRAQLTAEILALPHVDQRPSRFEKDTDAFYVGKREFAHFHPGNEIDLRLTRKRIRALWPELGCDPRVHRRTASGDWIEFRFPRKADVARAMELVEAAVEANR